jgi:hypothetical protein
VFLAEWQHTVDPATGALTLTITPLRDFSVRNDNGVVIGC